MGPSPVVDGHAPPARGHFGISAAGKRQRSVHLVGIHAPCGAIASLNRRRVGDPIAELLKRLMDALVGAVGRANPDMRGSPLMRDVNKKGGVEVC